MLEAVAMPDRAVAAYRLVAQGLFLQEFKWAWGSALSCPPGLGPTRSVSFPPHDSIPHRSGEGYAILDASAEAHMKP